MRQREGEEGGEEEDGVHHSQDQHQPDLVSKSQSWSPHSLKQTFYLWNVFCCFECAKNVVLKNIFISIIFSASGSWNPSPFLDFKWVFPQKKSRLYTQTNPPVLSKVNCFNEKSLDFGFLHYIMNPSLFLLIKCLAWFVPDNVESHTNGAYYHDQDTFHNELLQWVGRHHVLSDPKCCWFANERVPWRFTQPYRTVSEHFSILYV